MLLFEDSMHTYEWTNFPAYSLLPHLPVYNTEMLTNLAVKSNSRLPYFQSLVVTMDIIMWKKKNVNIVKVLC